MKSKKTKKSSRLDKKREDEYSTYWLKKCDKLIGEIWHTKYSTKICAVGASRSHYTDCKGVLCMHHLIGKEHYLYRWDVDNMIDLCSYHHDRFSKFSPHSTPELFLAWLSKNYSQKWQYILNNKGTITQKKLLPFTFKEKYTELENLQ
jgi:hypothetical protein